MLIKELSQIPGVSGDEAKVRSFIKEKLAAWGIEHYTDSMGNLYAYNEGRSKKEGRGLMLSAHMDEVGLMVSSIEKSGQLRFYKVGGVFENTLVSSAVKVGPRDVDGVIGYKAVHLQKKEEREKPHQVDKLYIDIGARNREDAEKVVSAGDYVSFATKARSSGDLIFGKALDNRAGCAALLELLGRKHPAPFCAVFTVQEEVGLRGAGVAAYRVNPRIALVIETTTAADLPDVDEHEQATIVGSGPALTLRDDSVITHRRVLERLLEVAEEEKIPCQFRRFTGSFTDAGVVSLSRSGVLTAVVSTPCRYIHSPVSFLNAADWSHLVELVSAFISSVDTKGLEP